MNLSLMMFMIGMLGFMFNSSNMMMLLMCMEIMMLACTLMILINAYNLDDLISEVYALYIMCMAGAESAMGLGMLVAYYRLSQTISLAG